MEHERVYLRISLDQKHPALIIGAPYGGVKEQGPCVYGNELAQKGFVVLTFDQSFLGDPGVFPEMCRHRIFCGEFQCGGGFPGASEACGQGKNRRDRNMRFRRIYRNREQSGSAFML